MPLFRQLPMGEGVSRLNLLWLPLSQDIALPATAMAVLRETGVIGHLAVQSEAAEPAIGEIKMDSVKPTPQSGSRRRYVLGEKRTETNGLARRWAA
jgi:hypothetical protein